MSIPTPAVAERKPPVKSNTLMSTWSNPSHDPEEGVTGSGIPSLFALLSAASKYDDPDSDDELITSGTTTPASVTPPPEPVTPPGEDKEISARVEDPRVAKGYQDASRLAQFMANDYNVPTDSKMLDGIRELPLPKSSLYPDAPISSGTNGRPDPAQILELLQEEFGVLTREGETEEFLKETDCCLMTDMAILGTTQLTNFRLTFHASLLSTRTDPVAQVIRSGPFIAHLPGLRRKRRRWLELSHDMLSAYANATDEARARPIRSTLLSSVQKVHEFDPAHPKSVTITFSKKGGSEIKTLDFDTTESAVDWRREIGAAVFEYRQRRHSATHSLGPSTEADKEARSEGSGVRICVPLHLIESYEAQHYMSFGLILTMNINNEDPFLVEAGNIPPYSGSNNDSNSPNTRQLKFFIFKADEGLKFDDILAAAKARRASHLDRPVLESDIVTVDFGPLTFVDDIDTKAKEIVNEAAKSPTKTKDKRSALESRMRTIFAIEESADVFVNRAWIASCISSAGYLLLSTSYLCFWSKSVATKDIRYRFPMQDVNTARPLSTSLFGHHLLGVEIRGQPLLQFAVQNHGMRDALVQRILSAKACHDRISGVNDVVSQLRSSSLGMERSSSFASNSSNDGAASYAEYITATPSATDSDSTVFSEHASTHAPPKAIARQATLALAPVSHTVELIRNFVTPNEVFAHFPKPINIPEVLRGMSKRHFVCLTIGSRGDVQPYIALCRGLIAEGHTATIVTHDEYKPWIEGFGVTHRAAGGDPGALMKLSVEHSMFSPQFFKESLGKFRGWLDDLLRDAWLACQDADVLIESPSAMAGVHIAEALQIPYLRAFTMPWTRTTAYPHAFLSPPIELSGSLNYSTYVVFDNVFWAAMSGQVNRWRKKMLNIKSTDIEHLAQTKVPFIYNFSESVVPKPLDWSDFITISGYWFLDNPDLKWEPSPELVQFISKAKADGVPLVYIGFGSIVVPHPHAMTRSIIKGVLKAGVRAIINKGWSDRLSTETEKEVPMPPECFLLNSVPHDWLFPQIDAAMHHGGAGTTGASLRAGIPTIIKPWFGDQYFWASRVHKLGAGLRVDNLGSTELANALKKATSDRVMKEKAAGVGEKIRKENGVYNAIRAIYMYLERASKDRTTL